MNMGEQNQEVTTGSTIEEDLHEDRDEDGPNSQLLAHPDATGLCQQIPCRYVLVSIIFAGIFNAFCVRNSFNMALVAMVNFTSEDSHSNDTTGRCPGYNSTGNDTSQVTTGEFNWDYEMQGQLMSAFYYGYTVTQLPGGYLAERFGGKIVLCVSVGVSSMLYLLTPLVARTDVRLLLASRIIMGMLQGPLYPANHAMMGRWAPLMERSLLFALTTAGATVANIISYLLTGYLCSTNLMGGWPSPFYIFGTLGTLWMIPWMLLVHDSPELHPRISQQEKEYIQQGPGHASNTQYRAPPWGSIFTSKAVWATMLYSLGDGIAYYCVFNCIPLFLKLVLNFDMSQNGIATAMPQVCQTVGMVIAGPLADLLRSRRLMTTKSTRKLFTLLGEGFGVVMMIALTFVECNATLVVVVISVGSLLSSFITSGAAVNHLDIAPMYAGTLLGISNALSNVGGFVGPLLVSAITHDGPDRSRWTIVFYFSAALYAAATGSFLLLGEGELQPWAIPKDVEIVVETESEDSRAVGVDGLDDTLGHINS